MSAWSNRRARAPALLILASLAGCGGGVLAPAVDAGSVDAAPRDAAAGADGPGAGGPDQGGRDGGIPGADGGPELRGAFTVLGAGVAFNDASGDQGGNVWAVTDERVYLFTAAGRIFTYDAQSGLAHGHTSWTDPYFCLGESPCPAVRAVSFSAVAGGAAGQAVVGNIGYVADRLDVDAASGAVRAVVGLEVGTAQQPDAEEREAQRQRVVATWRATLDMNGTFSGTAYLGGFHGTSALHGLGEPRRSGVCDCPDFEEHVHPFSVGGDEVYGGDVRALSRNRAGDIWIGDRRALYLLPQRSLGPLTDLFVDFAVLGPGGARALDVFPGVDDWIVGVGEDGEGAVWVASSQSGLARLAPDTREVSFLDARRGGLPSDALTGLDVDDLGAVWIATAEDGVVRIDPVGSGAPTLVRFTTASGLPSNRVRQVQADRHGAADHAVYIATDAGVAVYRRR